MHVFTWFTEFCTEMVQRAFTSSSALLIDATATPSPGGFVTAGIPGSPCSVREVNFLTWAFHWEWTYGGNSQVTLLQWHHIISYWGHCETVGLVLLSFIVATVLLSPPERSMFSAVSISFVSHFYHGGEVVCWLVCLLTGSISTKWVRKGATKWCKPGQRARSKKIYIFEENFSNIHPKFLVSAGFCLFVSLFCVWLFWSKADKNKHCGSLWQT